MRTASKVLSSEMCPLSVNSTNLIKRWPLWKKLKPMAKKLQLFRNMESNRTIWKTQKMIGSIWFSTKTCRQSEIVYYLSRPNSKWPCWIRNITLLTKHLPRLVSWRQQPRWWEAQIRPRPSIMTDSTAVGDPSAPLNRKCLLLSARKRITINWWMSLHRSPKT